MADKIDFPNGPSVGQYFTDDNGIVWRYSEFESWVKQFDYADEAPGIADIEYCKKNQNWSEIVYPVPEDADGAVLGNYTRTNGAGVADWVLTATNMGPLFDKTDGVLYGIRDGLWKPIPGDDLKQNYYDKTISDERFAPKIHGHDLEDGTLFGFGTLASANEPGVDLNDLTAQYVRVAALQDIPDTPNAPARWEKVVIPETTQRTSITIKDPILSDDAMLMHTDSEIKISTVRCWTQLGEAVSFRLVYSEAPLDSGEAIVDLLTNSDLGISGTFTCNDSTGEAMPSLMPITIPANSWIWLELSDVPGGVSLNATMFHATVTYTDILPT